MLQIRFRTQMEDQSDSSTHIVHSIEETEADVESEPNITADATASVVVQFEMADDSETANNQQSELHIQDATIKTEPFTHRNLAYDDETTHADSNNSMEYKGMCFKHEYKYEEDSIPVIVHNVEVGHSVLVKSEILEDSEMATSDLPHNVTNFQCSKIKTKPIVHQNQDYECNITHNDVKHSAECHSICFKHEYKYEEDTTHVNEPNVEADTACTTAIDKQHSCATCKKSFRYKGELRRHVRVHTGDKPYKCDMCGKSITKKSNLVKHMKIHTDDKPCSC
jgi:hypothetical protein